VGRLARGALRLGSMVAIRAPHETIAVSRALQSHFRRPGRLPVWIPNGVRAPRARPLNRLRRFGVEAGKFVLWMGRFVPEKRCEDLIRAFLDTKADARLLLAGQIEEDNAYWRRLRKMAAQADRIVFAGGLYGEDKDEALCNAALLALPSEVEGLPVVILEALAAGLCVVASDIEPCRELIVHGRTGWLYPVRDTQALARVLEWALGNPDATAAVGGRGRQALGEDYDWRRIAERTERVYERALGGDPA